MSDDFMLEDGDDYDFDFENSDEDLNDPNIALENQYYTAKAGVFDEWSRSTELPGVKDDSLPEALGAFGAVINMESVKTECIDPTVTLQNTAIGRARGFKALKQMIKINGQLGRLQEALRCYEHLLPYVKETVTRNYSEKTLNSILDRVAAYDDPSVVKRFYAVTLQALKELQNERLSVKTNLKLAALLLHQHDYTSMKEIIAQLHHACTRKSEDDDQLKGTHMLETYALEIQLYTEIGDLKALKHGICLEVQSAIPHPRIMGIIYECGGKMFMDEENWPAAQTDFFEAFKNYDEAGSPQRIQVLKYLVLANMLSQSTIDPFSSPETQAYRNDPDIQAMTNLVTHYQKQQVREFEQVFKAHEISIMRDPFMTKHMGGVLTTIRSQALLNAVKPYTRVAIDHLAKMVNVSTAVAKELLVMLILDEKIDARINQVDKCLEIIQR
ncbi:hypothetical protein H4R34_003033 [Dimargaris verticillata]|uniref:COP9 signalosome complex subunit 2 n=1 Tax=Dimargaris verticillata TaxID=2761393 RepID=A0A9W8B2Y3_9FUNG|nr:hypothetical protein H4R34_003033 [Dimargaris verticillata]